MNRASIEYHVRSILARMAGMSPDGIEASEWISSYGVDSLASLVFRETVERVLQVHLPDEIWVQLKSIGELMDYIKEEKQRLEDLAMENVSGSNFQSEVRSRSGCGWRLAPSGIRYDDIEIGMPLTGLNNLSEGPLLQQLGDLRWKHLSALCGVPSREINDAEGQRLYPTFFYVEMAFPEDRPMASYGENDRIKIAGTLKRFGLSMLDGYSYLLPPDYAESGELPFRGVEGCLEAGVPVARLSNIFVKQFVGAEWLKKSRPASPGFDRVPEMAMAPDSYLAVKQAGKDGYFSLPGHGYVPMTAMAVRTEYRLVADRDLNGAGLVYFANYPLFLDICERQVLASAELPMSEELIDRRTLIRRRSAYLNNASSRDTLIIEVQPWIKNPWATDHPAPEVAPIRLFLNFRMYRKSDQRLMMVSSAEKVILGRSMEEAPFFDKLLSVRG